MLQTFIPLLMPFKVPDHLLLLHKDAGAFRALLAMEVLPIVQLAALLLPALHRVSEPPDVPRIINGPGPFPQEAFSYHREGGETSAYKIGFGLTPDFIFM